MSRAIARALVSALLAVLIHGPAAALPTGYFVWTKGEVGDRTSRRIWRMTLPDKSDVRPLTSGEDVEGQISPDGVWVAYAKAKLPDSDYHQFHLWKIYVVSIHGAEEGRKELLVDDGYWPSWGAPGVLRYSQVHPDDPKHSLVLEVVLDAYGQVLERRQLFDTKAAFPAMREINECFVAPDGSWFAGRTRGADSVNGVGAYAVSPPAYQPLARAGSVGCMPYVAPSGEWGFIAGRDLGIRWGHAPHVADRRTDQVLIPPRGPGDLVYHPGISTDEAWVMAAHSTDDDHNAGPYDVYVYPLEGTTAGTGQPLAEGGFNGWPHLWVGEPSEPPPPRPHVDRFEPSSWTLVKGESATLEWRTSFADRVTLDGAPVDTEGGVVVTPDANTTYVLRAASSLAPETDEATLDLTVVETPQPVRIEAFAVEPVITTAGDLATLSWRVDYASTVELDGRRVPPVGSRAVAPIETTTFVLTASGHHGPVGASVTLEVQPLNPLLPDRGGCMCGASSGAFVGPALLFLAGFLLRRRSAG